MSSLGCGHVGFDLDRCRLYSQQIVPLKQGVLSSEELLLRMLGRDDQVVLPERFLPSAEKQGLIGEVDRWVVTRALRLAAAGRRVQVNLSAWSVVSGELLPRIKTELEATGADGGNIVFELTEAALTQDLHRGEAFARRAIDLGCGVALDDVGTSIGNFTYFKSLQIEYLKIKLDVVRMVSSIAAYQRRVEAIVSMAEGFGQRTMAVGVEDRETLELLRDYGVDFAQGYHLAYPQPVAANGR